MAAVEGCIATVVGAAAVTALGLSGVAHVKDAMKDKAGKAVGLTNLASDAFSQPTQKLNCATSMNPTEEGRKVITACKVNGVKQVADEAQLVGEVLTIHSKDEFLPVMCLGGADVNILGSTITLGASTKSVTLSFKSTFEASHIYARMLEAKKLPPPAMRIYELVEHVIAQEKMHQDNRKKIDKLESSHKKDRHKSKDPGAHGEGDLTRLKAQIEVIRKISGGFPAPSAEHGQAFDASYSQLDSQRQEVEARAQQVVGQLNETLANKERYIQQLQMQASEAQQIAAERDAHSSRARDAEDNMRLQAREFEQMKIMVAQGEQEMQMHRQRAADLEREVERMRSQGGAAAATNGSTEVALREELQQAANHRNALEQQHQQDLQAHGENLNRQFESEFMALRDKASRHESEAQQMAENVNILQQEREQLIHQLESGAGQGQNQEIQQQQAHQLEEYAKVEQQYQQAIAELEQRPDLQTHLGLQQQMQATEEKLRSMQHSAEEIVKDHGQKVEHIQALENALAATKAEAERAKAGHSDQADLMDTAVKQQELIQALENELGQARQALTEADAQRGQIAMLQAERDALHQRMQSQADQYEMQIKELAATAPSRQQFGQQDQHETIEKLSDENKMLKEQMASTWAQINEQMSRLDEERARYLEEVRRAKETPPTMQSVTYQNSTTNPTPFQPESNHFQAAQLSPPKSGYGSQVADRSMMQQQLDDLQQSFSSQQAPHLGTHYGRPSNLNPVATPSSSLTLPNYRREDATHGAAMADYARKASGSPYNSYVAGSTPQFNRGPPMRMGQQQGSPVAAPMTAPLSRGGFAPNQNSGMQPMQTAPTAGRQMPFYR